MAPEGQQMPVSEQGRAQAVAGVPRQRQALQPASAQGLACKAPAGISCVSSWLEPVLTREALWWQPPGGSAGSHPEAKVGFGAGAPAVSLHLPRKPVS